MNVTIGQNSDLLPGLPKLGVHDLARQELAVARVEPVGRDTGSARNRARLAEFPRPALTQTTPDQLQPPVTRRAVAFRGPVPSQGASAPFLAQLIAQSESDDAETELAAFAARDAADAYRRTAERVVSYHRPSGFSVLDL